MSRPKPCTDPEGNTYHTLTEMCEAHGVSYGTFNSRRRKGYPLEECLAPPTAPVTDAKGKEYRSIHALSIAKKIPDTTLRARMEKGMPIKDCLKKTKRQKQMAKTRSNPITDHLGNEFPTVSALCRHYNIKRGIYYHRIQKGWSIEDALMTPVKSTAPAIAVDYTGKEFPSRAAMCWEYHIAPETFDHRIKAGWTLEEALMTPLHELPESKIESEDWDYE